MILRVDVLSSLSAGFTCKLQGAASRRPRPRHVSRRSTRWKLSRHRACQSGHVTYVDLLISEQIVSEV